MYRGYVKAWRKTEDSPVWRMPPLYHRVWSWLLWRANHKGCRVPMGKFGLVIVDTGQVLTSIDKIAEGVSYYQRHVKSKPNKNTIYRILKWFANQEMIVIEKSCLTTNSRQTHEKRLKCNGAFTLITIVNWDTYQGELGAECNDESNAKVTAEGHKQELKRINKISCGKLEALKGFLTSLPKFVELPKETQRLITSFLDKARLSNRTQAITGSRVKKIFNSLVAISEETSLEYLNAALEITLHKAEAGQFIFSKQNVCGYVRVIAQRRYQKVQKAMLEKYEPQETDVEALYQ